MVWACSSAGPCSLIINNNGVKMLCGVKISGEDILCTSCFSAVKHPVQALLERMHLLFWVLVCSKVLLGLQRWSVHSLRLCHRFVPRNVGPLVVGGGLSAQQLNVLWHSKCMLAGCMQRGLST